MVVGDVWWWEFCLCVVDCVVLVVSNLVVFVVLLLI